VPLSISTYAFLYFFGHAGKLSPGLITSFGAWAVLIGLRNIAMHQQEDAEHDKRAGARTWALRMGPHKLSQLQSLFISLETIAFLVFLSLFGARQPYFISAFVLYMALWLTMPEKIRLNEFYEYAQPILALTILALTVDPAYTLFLIVHIVIYRHKYIIIAAKETLKLIQSGLVWFYFHAISPVKSFLVHLAYVVYWDVFLKPTVKALKAMFHLFRKR
jgi:hypothetical protein